MELITKCPQDKLASFLHSAINSYCNVIKAPYSKFSNVWTFDEWLDIKENVIIFYKELLRNSAKREGIIEDHLKNADEGCKKIILDVLQLRKNDLKTILSNEAISNEYCYLKNFDWELNLSLANNKLANTYDPHLNLTLEISTDENYSRNLQIEMDRLSLAKLISSLENAAKVIKEVKTQ